MFAESKRGGRANIDGKMRSKRSGEEIESDFDRERERDVKRSDSRSRLDEIDLRLSSSSTSPDQPASNHHTRSTQPQQDDSFLSSRSTAYSFDYAGINPLAPGWSPGRGFIHVQGQSQIPSQHASASASASVSGAFSVSPFTSTSASSSSNATGTTSKAVGLTGSIPTGLANVGGSGSVRAHSVERDQRGQQQLRQGNQNQRYDEYQYPHQTRDRQQLQYHHESGTTTAYTQQHPSGNGRQGGHLIDSSGLNGVHAPPNGISPLSHEHSPLSPPAKRRRVSTTHRHRINTTTDPRSIVMADMHNESDALQILAEAAIDNKSGGEGTGSYEGGDESGGEEKPDSSRKRRRSRGFQDTEGRRDDSEVADSHEGDVDEDEDEDEDDDDDEGDDEDQDQDENSRQGSSRRVSVNGHNRSHSITRHHPRRTSVQGETDHTVPTGPGNRTRSSLDARAHHPVDRFQGNPTKTKMDSFPLIEQEILEADQLVHLVRSFFKLQHPIFVSLATFFSVFFSSRVLLSSYDDSP